MIRVWTFSTYAFMLDYSKTKVALFITQYPNGSEVGRNGNDCFNKKHVHEMLDAQHIDIG